ncbi:MAG: type II toxin-antitoxin system RelE/ParE family toxin [Vicinamibacterales bacterium]
MNPPLQIEITDDAQAQITAASAWWAEHRPSAPDGVVEELDHILGLLRVQAEMGTRARDSRWSGVRRVTLPRIRYYLYYQITNNVLQVLALWHASRGEGPSL